MQRPEYEEAMVKEWDIRLDTKSARVVPLKFKFKDKNAAWRSEQNPLPLAAKAMKMPIATTSMVIITSTVLKQMVEDDDSGNGNNGDGDDEATRTKMHYRYQSKTRKISKDCRIDTIPNGSSTEKVVIVKSKSEAERQLALMKPVAEANASKLGSSHVT